MAFDPSTAQPAAAPAFDPTTAKPSAAPSTFDPSTAKPSSGIMSQIGDAAMSIPKAQAAGLGEIYKATTRRGGETFQDRIKGDLTAPVQGAPTKGVGNYVSKDVVGSRAPRCAGRDGLCRPRREDRP